MRAHDSIYAARRAQALVESCIVLMLIGLVFTGVYQVARLLAAREILQHAANRGVRARTVGFNRWMVEKVVRVASIPNAGKMLVPDFENEDSGLRSLVRDASIGQTWDYASRNEPVQSSQFGMERARVPFYLGSINRGRAGNILDYEHWDDISVDELRDSGVIGNQALDAEVSIRLSQDYPLIVPMHTAFYAADEVPLSVETSMENHYPLYLKDPNVSW